MTKNKYSHIKSFKDFEQEKMQLHYQIRLSEKRLEIKKLELREYINPIKLFTSFFNDLYRPAFDLAKTIITSLIERYKNKKETDTNRETEK